MKEKCVWKFKVIRVRDGWTSSKHRTETAAKIEAARVSKIFPRESFVVAPF